MTVPGADPSNWRVLEALEIELPRKFGNDANTGPGREIAGSVTKAQVREIAEQKMKDLNCDTIEAAMRMVEGSARSMGIEIKG